MLTVLHILGNEPHESVQRNIYDESLFLMRHGIDVRFAYDPWPATPFESNFIDELRDLGFLMYKLPYLARKNGMSPAAAALTLRAICGEYNIDVVHTHTEPAYRLACRARLMGARAVHIFTAHAVASLNPFAVLYSRILSLWCDDFVAIDDYTAGVLMERRIRAAKIKRVNYGINMSEWKKENQDSKRRPDKLNAGGDGAYTLLMIADSDEIVKTEAFDAFTDLILRLLHDYDPLLSDNRELRFIISTNSEKGLARAKEMIGSMELGDYVEITALSAPDGVSPKKTYKQLFGGETVNARRALFLRSDICLYYSENRFYPYPAAEAIALNIPTLTNDRNFFIKGFENSPKYSVRDDNAGAGAGYDGTGTGAAGGYGDGYADAGYGGRGGAAGAGRTGGAGSPGYAGSSADAGGGVSASGAAGAGRTSGAGRPGNAGSSGGASIAGGGVSASGGYGVSGNSGASVGYGASGAAGAGRTGGAGGPGNAGSAGGSGVTGDTVGGAGGVIHHSPVNFGKPDTIVHRILALLYDGKYREAFTASERQAVGKLYDMEDMIMGIYDAYVRGLRV